jgi:hypothetical protein
MERLGTEFIATGNFQALGQGIVGNPLPQGIILHQRLNRGRITGRRLGGGAGEKTKDKGKQSREKANPPGPKEHHGT